MNDDDIDLSSKSKTTQAIYLFKNDKKPLEVAIDLDISASEIEDILQEYWVLNQPDELALAIMRSGIILIISKLFHAMKKNKLINQKDIQAVIRYAAFDLPPLESKMRKLTSEIIDLEFKKKDLNNTIMLQRAQLSDLGQTIIKYQNIIKRKK